MLPVGISHYINTVAGLSFTVDNTIREVDVAKAGLPVSFFDANGFENFQYGENVFIESIRVQLPYGFGNGNNTVASPAETGIHVELNWRDFNGNADFLFQFGSNGMTRLPTFNCDLPVNTMIDQPAAIDSKWKIQLPDFEASISMLNVPDILHTDVLLLRVFLKVRHTLAMIA